MNTQETAGISPTDITKVMHKVVKTECNAFFNDNIFKAYEYSNQEVFFLI